MPRQPRPDFTASTCPFSFLPINGRKPCPHCRSWHEEEQLPLLEVAPATPGEVLFFGRYFDRLVEKGGGRRGRGRGVAVLVTPPLCPMGRTFAPETAKAPVYLSSASLSAMGGTFRSKSEQA